MALVFHRPVVADESSEFGCIGSPAVEVAVVLHCGCGLRLVGLAHRLASHAGDALQPSPFSGLGPPTDLA